jgi:VWFA-related protein
LWRYGDTFRAPDGSAEGVWEKLAGASPADPARFFETLLKADRGRLAGFYAAVSRADPAHRKFLLQDVTRAQRFYTWFREAEEPRAALLQAIPLDDAGRVRFPGGRQAWSSSSASADDEILWPPQTSGGNQIVNAPPPVDLDALVALARLEHDRGGLLDAESARLVARNFSRWRALLPFFAALPRLGAAEFQALEAFSAAAQKHPAQEPLMREWHSLAALIVLARKAGSLDDEAAARAFGRVCRDLTAPDHSAKAVALVRDLSGGGTDLDEAVVNGLLRLNGPGRDAFDRVREPLAAPHLRAPADVGPALSGIVYGALLNPDSLLVNEDRELLRKHTFAPQGALFSTAALNRSNIAPGSRFTGGFMKFDEVSRDLARAGGVPSAKARPAPSSEAAGLTFRTNARLVEVYATVTDGQGRLLDGLRSDQFTILDGGQPVKIAAFENGTAALSCALLLDTSQSMEAALPALKSAALKLIAGLRPDDAVGIYSLNGGISELQPFTKDKGLAARVTLRAELGELTALYDGLVRVNRDLAARTGKKVIVVFTDGEDNDSTLSAATAILRAKTVGIPIYTIAQGHALGHAALLKELSGISQATGGLSFRIGSAAEIGPVFDSVLQDLLHGYLLAFQPQSMEGHTWRSIEVRAPGNVRAREGYYPE